MKRFLYYSNPYSQESIFPIFSQFNKRHSSANYKDGLQKINPFICYWMSKRLKMIMSENPMIGDFRILRRIFSSRKKYYDLSGLIFMYHNLDSDLYEDMVKIGIANEFNKNIIQDSPWTSMTKHNVHSQSMLYTANIFCFAKLGGFEYITAYLSKNDLTLDNLILSYKLIKTVSLMTDALNPEHLHFNVLPIIRIIIEKSRKLVEEFDLKSQKSKYIERLIKAVQIMTCKIKGNEHLVGPLQILWTARMLNSQAFANRNSAVREILAFIDRLPIKWPLENIPNEITKKMANEIKSAKVLDIFMSETFRHKEFITQITEHDFFGFMYAWDEFEKRHIDLLWERAIEDIDGMYVKSFNSLIIHFNKKDALEIFSRIKSIPLNKFMPNIVEILNTLSKNELLRNSRYQQKQIGFDNTIERIPKNNNDIFAKPVATKDHIFIKPDENKNEHEKQKETHFEIISYIFSLINDEYLIKGLSYKIQEIFISKFTNLLIENNNNNSASELCLEYAQKSEEMLANDVSPFQMLTVFEKLATHLANKGKFVTLVAELFQRVVVNMIRVKLNVVQQAAGKNSVDISQDSIDSFYGNIITNINTKTLYYQDLEKRFLILETIINLGKHTIRPESFTVLCEAFVNNNISKMEREIFFSFMRKISVPQKSEPLLNEKCFDFFLYEILFRLNPSQYSQQSFECLKNLTIAINAKYGKIKIRGNYMDANSLQLIGLKCFWDLALISEDPKVNELSSLFLLELYKSLRNDTSSNNIKHKEQYLKECLNKVKDANQENEKCGPEMIRKSQIALKALDLLSKCLSETESKTNHDNIKNNFSQSGSNEILNLNDYIHVIAYYTGGQRLAEMKFSSNTTLRTLLLELEPLSVNYQVAYISNIGILRPCEKTLKQLNIPATLQVVVEKPSDLDIYQIGPITSPTGSGLMQMMENIVKELPEIMHCNALVKARGDLTTAIEYISDPEKIKEIEKETNINQNNDIKNSSNNKESSEKISKLIAQSSEYFPILFVCLHSTNEQLAKKVWEIVAKLPLSEAILNELINGLLSQVRKMEPIDWRIMFPHNKIYKLAYSVKVLSRIFICSPFEDTQFDKSKEISTYKGVKSAEWTDVFIRGKGFEYLCYLIEDLGKKENLAKIANDKDMQNVVIYCIETLVGIIKSIGIHAFLSNDSSLLHIFIKHADFENKNKDDEKIRVRTEFNPASITQIILSMENTGCVAVFVTLIKNLCETLIGSHLVDITKINNIFDMCFYMIGATLSVDPKFYNQLYKDDIFADFLLQTLKDSQIIEHKKILIKYLSIILKTNSIQKLPEGTQKLSDYLFNTLATMLPNPAEDCQNSELYLSFFTDLLDVYVGVDQKISQSMLIYELPTLLKIILSYIFERLSQDEISYIYDKQLIGYFKIILAIHKLKLSEIPKILESVYSNENDEILKLSQKLIEETFGQPGNSPLKINGKRKIRKCGQKPSLSYSLELLFTISQINTKSREILYQRINEFNEDQLKNQSKETGYEGGLLDESNGKQRHYVGLKNFGATCYVNSMLQQLFMMPSFRRLILSIPADKIPLENCDRVIYNLQKIFAYLMLSDQKYYLPEELYNDLKWSDGRKIDVRQQNDTDEFFNLLSDKLGNELKGLEQEKQLQEIMNSVLTEQIESLDLNVKYTKEIDQTHFKISLDIKGKKTLEEALDATVKGSILEGENMYNCEEYQRKIRVNKSCIIKSLANTVIIHLERFQFNYKNMQREKLYDYFAFPTKLNMLKWTKESSADTVAPPEIKRKYDYELVGILNHIGTADAGHYISYIKERDKNSAYYNKWFEFNDTNVSEFNIDTLASNCFGKNKESSQSDYFQNDIAWAINNPTAYLLIYEKIDQPEKPEIIVPEHLKNLIEQDNLANANIKIYCDNTYAEFLLSLLKLSKPICVTGFTENMSYIDLENENPMNLPKKSEEENEYYKMCKMIFIYSLDYVNRVHNYKKFKEFSAILTNHAHENSLFALWILKYLSKSKSILIEQLTDIKLDESRHDFITIITNVIHSILKVENPYLMSKEKIVLPNSGESIYKSSILRFLQILTSDCIHAARINWKKCAGLFELLHLFAISGYESRKTLICEFSLIPKLIDFVSNTEFCLYSGDTTLKRPKMDITQNKLTEPVLLLCSLIKETVTLQMKLSGKTVDSEIKDKEKIIDFSEEWYNLLLLSDKWNFMNLAVNNQAQLSKILAHLLWNNAELQSKVFPKIILFIVNNRGGDYQASLDTLAELILLNDPYIKLRLSAVFFETKIQNYDDIFEFLSTVQTTQTNFVLDFLACFAKIIGRIELLESNKVLLKKKLKWVPAFIDTRPGDVKLFSFNLWSNSAASEKRKLITEKLTYGLDLSDYRGLYNEPIKNQLHFEKAQVEPMKIDTENAKIPDKASKPETNNIPQNPTGQNINNITPLFSDIDNIKKPDKSDTIEKSDIEKIVTICENATKTAPEEIKKEEKRSQ